VFGPSDQWACGTKRPSGTGREVPSQKFRREAIESFVHGRTCTIDTADPLHASFLSPDAGDVRPSTVRATGRKGGDRMAVRNVPSGRLGPTVLEMPDVAAERSDGNNRRVRFGNARVGARVATPEPGLRTPRFLDGCPPQIRPRSAIRGGPFPIRSCCLL
jgi:hypothetical protein